MTIFVQELWEREICCSLLMRTLSIMCLSIWLGPPMNFNSYA